jgi:hypothetical protein
MMGVESQAYQKLIGSMTMGHVDETEDEAETSLLKPVTSKFVSRDVLTVILLVVK